MTRTYGHSKSNTVRTELAKLESDWTIVLDYEWSRTAGAKTGAALSDCDVLIIVPDVGIVYLEVKESSLKFENGVWHQLNRGAQKWKRLVRSPVEQSRDSQGAIDKFLTDALELRIHKQQPCSNNCAQSQGSHLSSYSGVWFPDAEGEMSDLATMPNSPHAVGGIESLLEQIKRLPRRSAPISAENIDLLVRTLCPNFVLPCRPQNRTEPVNPSPNGVDIEKEIEEISTQYAKRWVSRIESSGVLATESQSEIFGLLDQHVEKNASAIEIVGSAGTGKTLIAAHLAVLLANRGEKVLLTCRRRSLLRWLEENARLSRQILTSTSGSTTSKMPTLSNLESFVHGDIKPGFLGRIDGPHLREREEQILIVKERIQKWENGLHQVQGKNFSGSYVKYHEDKLRQARQDLAALYSKPTPKTHLPKFDVVIVDEAQSLNREWQQLVSNLITRDGVVVFLGDPSQKSGHSKGQLLDRGIFPRSSTFHLYENCRNTREIFNSSVARTPRVKELTSAVGPPGRPVVIEAQVDKLGVQVFSVLNRLFKQHGKFPRDAFVVVPHTYDKEERRRISTAVKQLGVGVGQEYLTKYGGVFVGDPFEVLGFEKSVVLVIATDDQPPSHFYIACSRARSHLGIICSKALATKISSSLKIGD